MASQLLSAVSGDRMRLLTAIKLRLLAKDVDYTVRRAKRRLATEERINEMQTTEETKPQHSMAIMGKEGDTKIMWSADRPEEVENARNSFNALREKRYLAFRVNEKGDKGEQMKEFDPKAEKIILVPPMAGG